jgi:hypothetical protein
MGATTFSILALSITKLCILTLSIMDFNMMALSIRTLKALGIMTISIVDAIVILRLNNTLHIDTQHNNLNFNLII